jgi:hypothetical protein
MHIKQLAMQQQQLQQYAAAIASCTSPASFQRFGMQQRELAMQLSSS